MDKYYFIETNSKAKGTPIALEGSIHKKFIPKQEYIKNNKIPPVLDREEWRMGGLNIEQLPEQLYLINKHKIIDFDFYRETNGFIISELFKTILDKHNSMDYISTPITIINREGEINATKKYFFIVIKEDTQAIDFKKSIFKKLHPIKPEVGIRFPYIGDFSTRLVFAKHLFGGKSVFYINQPYLNDFLYCNEEFKMDIEKNKLKTVSFYPIEDVITYLAKYDSLGLSNTKLIIEE